ncbi:MAG: hypothetical protein KDC92_00875 [Bacteroidetes bacterium]|nr:hypothetical protein [Bacteroidota bacterium]
MIILTFSSCKKEGCTNPNAQNYNADATEDDGTCTFARDAFIGNYSVSQTCVFENDTTFQIKVEAGPNDNEIVISNFFGWNANIRATVKDNEITFKEEQLETIFEGTGYLSGQNLILNFKACESVYYPCSEPESCTSNCIRN